MLFSGSCTVKPEPPPPIRDRNIIERGFCAPKRSFIIRAYSRRPARNFATSSKSRPQHVKLNDRRGANSSTGRPRFTSRSAYAATMRSPYAISWAGVHPASRMW